MIFILFLLVNLLFLQITSWAWWVLVPASIAIIHFFEESKSEPNLTKYFGKLFKNIFVQRLPSFSLPLIALVLQLGTLYFWVKDEEGMEGLYVGLCLGDFFFSHYLTSKMNPKQINPGIFSSVLLLFSGVIVLINNFNEKTLFMTIPGILFFFLTPIIIKISGKFLNWLYEGKN